jgi:hypothetical protein
MTVVQPHPETSYVSSIYSTLDNAQHSTFKMNDFHRYLNLIILVKYVRVLCLYPLVKDKVKIKLSHYRP